MNRRKETKFSRCFPKVNAIENEISLLSTTTAQEEYPRFYYEWTSEEVQSAITGWAEEYPDLIHVSTSQETLGPPSAGNPEDCPFLDGDDVGCLNYYGIIQD